MDFNRLNALPINKCIVEFLRYNGWIKEWFPFVDYSGYSLFSGNYYHLPLDEKLRIIKKVKLPSISVCEKVHEHHIYWKNNFNPNPLDCCNLRLNPQQSLVMLGDKQSGCSGECNGCLRPCSSK